MTFKERTSEFNSIVQSAKQRKEGNPSSVGIRNNKNKKTIEKSQFFQVAAQIGKDISETAEKLERLGKLARKKSLFDDPTIEIQELTAIINQDIKNLNNQIGTLQQRNTLKKNKHVQTHSETIMDSLRSKLKMTTKDFSEVLGVRTENLKNQQREKENFTGSQSPALSGKRTYESPLYKSHSSPQLSEGSNGTSGSEIIISMPQTALLTQERYASNRAEAVQSIEKILQELQGIFVTISNIVAEQGELVDRIDRDTEQTAINVNEAQNQLLKYMSNISSNRWLIVKMFLVLVFFVVLFIVFFV